MLKRIIIDVSNWAKWKNEDKHSYLNLVNGCLFIGFLAGIYVSLLVYLLN